MNATATLLVSAVSFTAPVVRCAHGAWGNRTHSAHGTIAINGEVLDWAAFRDYDRDATGNRTSYDILIQRNGRELTAAKWSAARDAIRYAFKAAIDCQNEETDAKPFPSVATVAATNARLAAADAAARAVAPAPRFPVPSGSLAATFAGVSAVASIVTGRSVDGTEYYSAMGWTGEYRAALVMSPDDAAKVAEREETAAAATRTPDNGVYGIKATPWGGPRLYSFTEYLADEAESARLDALYAN